MQNQNSATFIASCIGIGLAERLTEARRWQLQKDYGWSDGDLLFWYADSVAHACSYAETIHSVIRARRATGLLSGRKHAERLLCYRGLPTEDMCYAAIKEIKC